MQLELNSFQEWRACNGLNANENFIDELKIQKTTHRETLVSIKLQKKKDHIFLQSPANALLILQ